MTLARARRGGRRWPIVLACSAAVLAISGSQLLAAPTVAGQVPQSARLVAGPDSEAESEADPTPTAGRPTTTPGTRTVAKPGSTGWPRRSAGVPKPSTAPPVPTRLRADDVGLDLPIDPVGVDRRGQMELPDRPDRLGWYEYGAAPVSGTGAVVLGGHLDSERYGTGPLVRAGNLSRGDRIEIESRSDRAASASVKTVTSTYRVVAVERIAKSDFAGAGVFRRTGAPLLRLITCGGVYDPERGGYQDNLVVTAEPV